MKSISLNPHSKSAQVLESVENLDVNSLEKYKPNDVICGVYFLFSDNEIVYVGKSKDIQIRIHKHCNNKCFDYYSYIELSEKDLHIVERYFINKYLPLYNIDPLTQKYKEEMRLIKNITGKSNRL